MAWHWENKGLESNWRDDPRVYLMRVWNDQNEEKSEFQTHVSIPKDVTGAPAKTLALTQIKAAVEEKKAEMQATQLFPIDQPEVVPDV